MPISAEDVVESDSTPTATIKIPNTNPRTERFIFIASLSNLKSTSTQTGNPAVLRFGYTNPEVGSMLRWRIKSF
jgi:hypothetical protein